MVCIIFSLYLLTLPCFVPSLFRFLYHSFFLTAFLLLSFFLLGNSLFSYFVPSCSDLLNALNKSDKYIFTASLINIFLIRHLSGYLDWAPIFPSFSISLSISLSIPLVLSPFLVTFFYFLSYSGL